MRIIGFSISSLIEFQYGSTLIGVWRMIHTGSMCFTFQYGSTLIK